MSLDEATRRLIAERVDDLLAQAPPLTDHQRERLRVLLAPAAVAGQCPALTDAA